MPTALLNWMPGEVGSPDKLLRKDLSKTVHLLSQSSSKPIIKVSELVSSENCADGPTKLLDWKE